MAPFSRSADIPVRSSGLWRMCAENRPLLTFGDRCGQECPRSVLKPNPASASVGAWRLELFWSLVFGVFGCRLVIGDWSFSGVWSLVFGVFPAARQSAPARRRLVFGCWCLVFSP